MLAKFENSSFEKNIYTSVVSYRNLQNLPHWHKEHEILSVVSGEISLTVNHTQYLLNAGRHAFIHGEDIHNISSVCEDTVVHVIKTSAPGTSDILRHKTLLSPMLSKDYGLNSTIERLKYELNMQPEYCFIVSNAVILCVIAEIFRNEPHTILPESKKSFDEEYRKLLEWLTQNFETVTFSEAASYMHYCEPYFSKYFKKMTGMPFTDYINTLKIAAAIEKIDEGKMHISEISISCGFNTIRHFNRVFKKLTGYSPKDLPSDYVFSQKGNETIGFDPTLSCTQILS